MKRVLQVALAGLLLACSAFAQTEATKDEAKPDTKADAKTAAGKKATGRRTRRQGEEVGSGRSSRRFWLSMSVGSVFDSNINHDPSGVKSFGLVPGFGVHFRDNVEQPSIEIDYETAMHRYTKTDEFNRFSHYLTAAYRRRLSRRWYAKTVGEMALKGSSEDRDVSNQYVLEQQFQYRLTPSNRLTAFAAYRLKRYPLDDRGSNAIDSYVGGKFEQRLKHERRWMAGYRYDKNRTWDANDRYVRWTYNAEFGTPLSGAGRDLLTLGARYSPRLYARQIKVNGSRVARHDRRWAFDVDYERLLKPDLRVNWSYSYETRDSNDTDKKFNSHRLGLAFTFDWWK